MIGVRDRAIAQLVAQGLDQPEVAQLSGVSIRTVQRVVAQPEVAREIERLQEQGIEFDPPRVALRNALLAVKANGQPDHQTRVQAARALLASAPPVDPTPSSSANGGFVLLHMHLDPQNHLLTDDEGNFVSDNPDWRPFAPPDRAE